MKVTFELESQFIKCSIVSTCLSYFSQDSPTEDIKKTIVTFTTARAQSLNKIRDWENNGVKAPTEGRGGGAGRRGGAVSWRYMTGGHFLCGC